VSDGASHDGEGKASAGGGRAGGSRASVASSGAGTRTDGGHSTWVQLMFPGVRMEAEVTAAGFDAGRLVSGLEAVRRKCNKTW